MPKVSLANAIAWQCERHNIGIKNLAEAAGVHRASLHNFLYHGGSSMNSETVERVLSVLGLSIAVDMRWKPPEHLVRRKSGPKPMDPELRKTRRSYRRRTGT